MEIILRATAIYFFLWLLTRALGKRELAEMTAFELLLLMVVGDLIQQGVTQEDTSVTGAVLAVGTIAVWILIFSWLGYRFRPVRKLVEGVPVVVVRNGRPIEPALKLERVALEELLESARNQGIANLRDIDLAILEPSGQFSFLKRQPGDEAQGAPEKHKT
ncbi:MAG TPA: YetF domain-containing protein [Acidimicrobiia bacterium]|nr:YetF domain-containing protein [Acidimicrobiia bacterium]